MKLPGRLIRKASGINDIRYDRFLLDPIYESQGHEFASVFEEVWASGGWTVYLDELYYLTQIGLTPHINRLLTQGRSMGITMVTGMQRPTGITRFALSQSSHVLVFAQEGRDAKTIGEATSPRMVEAVEELREHEFAWYHRNSRQIWKGKLQDLLP